MIRSITLAVLILGMSPVTSDAEPPEPPEPSGYELWVVTEPAEAKIEITSHDVTYYDGIKLASGRYKLRVSREGYVTQDRLIRILRSTHTEIFRLERVAATPADD